MQEQDFRKSLVWKKSRGLLLALFSATETLPLENSYDLSNQIRHDCLSMVTNIVKGCGELVQNEMADFFRTAWRAAGDLESHLLAACCHGLLTPSSYERFAHEVTTVKGMLAVYIK